MKLPKLTQQKANLINQILYFPLLPRPTEKQNIYVELEIYIYSVIPQKTEITFFIFLLQ